MITKLAISHAGQLPLPNPICQYPGTDGFTHPLKDAALGENTFRMRPLIFSVELNGVVEPKPVECFTSRPPASPVLPNHIVGFPDPLPSLPDTQVFVIVTVYVSPLPPSPLPQAIYDVTLHTFLDSYLRYAPR